MSPEKRRAERWPEWRPTPHEIRYSSKKMAEALGISEARLHQVYRARERYIQELEDRSPKTYAEAQKSLDKRRHKEHRDRLKSRLSAARASTEKLEEWVERIERTNASSDADEQERVMRRAIASLADAAANVRGLLLQQRRDQKLPRSARLVHPDERKEAKELEARVRSLAKAVRPANPNWIPFGEHAPRPFAIRFEERNGTPSVSRTVKRWLSPDWPSQPKNGHEGAGYDLFDFAWKCAGCGGRFFALTGQRLYCRDGRKKCQEKGNRQARTASMIKRRARERLGAASAS